MKRMISLLTAVSLVLLFCGCSKKAETTSSAEDSKTTESVIYDSAVYAMPLVMMDITKQAFMGTEKESDFTNAFIHYTAPATAESKLIVRENVDTLYSICYLDLSNGPIVLKKPAADRYCSIEVRDAYTNCVSILGTGGDDNGAAAKYVFSNSDTEKQVLDGAQDVYIPTNMAWMLVRTECFGSDYVKNVKDIQDKLLLNKLSSYENTQFGSRTYHDLTSTSVPLQDLSNMDVTTFFDRFNSLSVSNPGTKYDENALYKFAKYGIGAGLTFDLNKLSSEVVSTVETYPKKQIEDITKKTKASSADYFYQINNWSYSKNNISNFGTDYEFRAAIALTGLGANPVSMAIYPSTTLDSDGGTLDGSNNYTIHFDNGQLPPNHAFWSITAYDDDGFLIDNPSDNYAVASRDSFVKNSDGSIDLYVRVSSPGADK